MIINGGSAMFLVYAFIAAANAAALFVPDTPQTRFPDWFSAGTAMLFALLAVHEAINERRR